MCRCIKGDGSAPYVHLCSGSPFLTDPGRISLYISSLLGREGGTPCGSLGSTCSGGTGSTTEDEGTHCVEPGPGPFIVDVGRDATPGGVFVSGKGIVPLTWPPGQPGVEGRDNVFRVLPISYGMYHPLIRVEPLPKV